MTGYSNDAYDYFYYYYLFLLLLLLLLLTFNILINNIDVYLS